MGGRTTGEKLAKMAENKDLTQLLYSSLSFQSNATKGRATGDVSHILYYE